MGVFQEYLPQKPGECKHLSSTTLWGKRDNFHMRCQFKGKRDDFSTHNSSSAQVTPTAIPPKDSSLQTLQELVQETTPDLTCLCTHSMQELLQMEFSSLRLTPQSSLSHCFQDVHEINQAMPSGSGQYCSPCCSIPRGPSVVRAASLAQPKGSICAV